MKRFIGILVLMLAMVAPTFAQKTLEIGTSEEGKIKNTSTASYTFTAEAEQIVVFTLNSEDFDPILDIESASGEVLVSDDDGGNGLNSRIVFFAPEAGDYTVVVRAYSGDGEGSYVLSSSDDVAQLAFGESVVVSLLENSIVQSFFIAEVGEVISLSAVAVDETVDTNLTVVGPDGIQIGFSEDANGLNPMIIRTILPLSGMYSVTLAPYSGDDFGKVTLLLEKTELLLLSADPLNLRFVDNIYNEIVGFNTEQGTLYEVSLDFDKEVSGTIEIQGIDSTGYGYFNFTGAEGASFVYRAKETGLMQVRITYNGSDFPVEYTIKAVTVGE